MSMNVICPQCDYEYLNVPDEALGKKTTCKQCQEKFTIKPKPNKVSKPLHRNKLASRIEPPVKESSARVEGPKAASAPPPLQRPAVPVLDSLEEVVERVQEEPSSIKVFGSGLFYFGVGSMVLSLIGLEFKILIWVDFWGPMVGWAIRTGMALVGGLMWIFGTLGERDSQRKITLYATGFSILIVVLIGLGLMSGQSKVKLQQSIELNNKAVNLMNAGNTAETIPLFNQAIANNPDDPKLYRNRGKAFLDEKKYKEALADFDKAIAMGGTNGILLNNRGLVLQAIDRVEEAIIDFGKSLAIEADATTFQNRGYAFYTQKKHKESLADYDKAIAMGASNDILFNNRGLVLYDLDRVEEAIVDYGKSLAIKETALTYGNRGQAFSTKKKCKESLADFDKAITMGASDDILFNNRGNSLFALGRVEEAIIDYGKSLAIKPGAPAFQNRGHAFFTKKKYKESLADYDKAIAMGASDDILFNNRGLVLHDLNRVEEAILDYGKSLSIKETAVTFQNRGYTFYTQNKYKEALADYDKSIDMGATNVFNNRGLVLKSLGRVDEAIIDYGKSLALNPDAPAFQNRGYALYTQNKYKEALADFDKAIAMGASNQVLFNNRGLVLNALDRDEEALIDYGKSLSIKENATTHNNKAVLLFRMERYEEALISLDKSLAISVDNLGVLMLRGNVCFQLKRFDEAIKDFILHAANNKTSLNVWNFNVIMDSSFSLCTV